MCTRLTVSQIEILVKRAMDGVRSDHGCDSGGRQRRKFGRSYFIGGLVEATRNSKTIARSIGAVDERDMKPLRRLYRMIVDERRSYSDDWRAGRWICDLL